MSLYWNWKELKVLRWVDPFWNSLGSAASAWQHLGHPQCCFVVSGPTTQSPVLPRILRPCHHAVSTRVTQSPAMPRNLRSCHAVTTPATQSTALPRSPALQRSLRSCHAVSTPVLPRSLRSCHAVSSPAARSSSGPLSSATECKVSLCNQSICSVHILTCGRASQRCDHHADSWTKWKLFGNLNDSRATRKITKIIYGIA